MRSTHLCWSLILAFVLASPAFPAIRPSFRLDHSAWKATHVVLGITTLTDGTFEVVESWKGDLQAGARLVIPELRPLADAEPISVRPKSSEPRFCEPGSQLIPKEPPGSTVILFLVRSTDQVPTTPGSKAEIGGWKPSDIMDSMLASVVWIDGGELYAFEQVVNPGVPLLCKLPLSETQARDRVTEISETQAQIATATSLQNSEERAERLKPYVSSDIFPARRTAITELGKTGPSAVPVISSMLDDSLFPMRHPIWSMRLLKLEEKWRDWN